MKHAKTWMLCILFIATAFRFVYLDRIPTAISGDELLYVITAKSVFLTGHDLTGMWNPLSAFLFRYPPGEQQAELPYFIHLFFSAPFPFSLFLAKLPFAILSIGIVFLLYGVAQKLFGNAVAIATGLIAAVNPWLVVMGRTGYESTPATFFYLLALLILLSTDSWNILWSLVPFLLAFYSYIGTKLIFIPFVLLAVLLTYKRTTRKPYIVLVCSCAAFTGLYLILLKLSPTGSRLSEILLPSSAAVATQVNEIRKTAIQTPILPLLINKYVVYLQIIFSKLFRIFSPTYLFMEGDQFFLPVRQSFFYYLDFLFMLWGALTLFSQKRKYFFILCGFIVIGTLPQLFNTTIGDFSGHLALMFPFLIILIGAGISDCITHIRSNVRLYIVGLIALLYACNIASFSFIYFFQYPLVGAGDFPMRVLTKYLTIAKDTSTPITVYSNRKGDLLKKYLFYSNTMNVQNMQSLSHLQTTAPFDFNQIHFTDCDASVTPTHAPTGILIYDQSCSMHVAGPTVKISSLLDGGTLYHIINDTICRPYPLRSYAIGITMHDFDINHLSNEQFCLTYLTK